MTINLQSSYHLFKLTVLTEEETKTQKQGSGRDQCRKNRTRMGVMRES
jgi:hypothetical protein